MAHGDDATWARAFMASAGVHLGDDAVTRHHSPAWQEARAVATLPERLRQLAVDREVEVREGVASRGDCPLGILIALAHDRAPDVRIAVAGSARLSRAIAELLCGDRESSVLKALARNDSLPLDLLERLAFHKREDVRRLAARRLDQRRGAAVNRTDADAAPDPSGTVQGAVMMVPLPPELRDRWTPTGERLRPAT